MRRVRGRSALELGRLGRHAGEDDDRHVGRRRDDDVAARSAAQPQIDDGGHERGSCRSASSPSSAVSAVTTDEAVHLEELHERPSDRHVVFDDEHQAVRALGHGYGV